jgi:hypothetical protein
MLKPIKYKTIKLSKRTEGTIKNEQSRHCQHYSTLSQILPSTYPFVLLKVTVIQKTTNKQNRKKKPKQVKKKQKSKQNKGKKKQIKR